MAGKEVRIIHGLHFSWRRCLQLRWSCGFFYTTGRDPVDPLSEYVGSLHVPPVHKSSHRLAKLSGVRIKSRFAGGGFLRHVDGGHPCGEVMDRLQDPMLDFAGPLSTGLTPLPRCSVFLS
jgi:hypothetical protein